MRRAKLVSFVLWSTVAPGVALVACGSDGVHHLPDGPPAEIDLPAMRAVDFGDASCGSAPDSQTLAFHNTGFSTLTWTTSIVGPGFSVTSGASGTAEPGEMVQITLAADAIPSSTVVGAQLAAKLVLTTNASETPVEVPLTVRAHGGSLHLATAAVGFGQIQLTAPSQQTLDISNTGDRPIDLALGAPPDPQFTATWTGAPAPVTVAPAGSLAGATARFTPASAGIKTTRVPITATGPVCAGDAPSVTLSGEGTAAMVSVAPGTLQFGTTSCGATAAAKTVMITNAYGFAITYTAAILTGPYTIAAGQQAGSIPANGSITLTVTASAVPNAAASIVANALAGTMRVTTSAPASTPANLTMTQAASGAILAVTPAGGTTLNFGDVVAGTPVSAAVSVKNTGNLAATITAAVTGSGYSSVAPGNGTVPTNGVDATGSVIQTVAQRGTLPGTLTIATTTPLCQAAAPTTTTLTAVGRAPIAVVSAAPAMSASCGGASTTPVNITVQNTGDAPLTITSATASGGFILGTTFPLTIAANASTTVSIRPPLAVIGTDVGGSTKSGNLSLVTNEIGTPTRTVALASTVMGANLALTDSAGNPVTSASFTATQACPASQRLYVRNTGNLTANVQIATANFQLFQFSGFSPSSTIPPSTGVSHALSVWTVQNACTGTETIQYTATGTICRLPGSLAASFNISGQSSCFCS